MTLPWKTILSLPCELGGQLTVVTDARLTGRDLQDLSDLVALSAKGSWPSKEAILSHWECQACHARHSEEKLIPIAAKQNREGCPDCGHQCVPILRMFSAQESTQ
jgi:hypothetical protein